MQEQTLPHSLESERALLGSILLDSSLLAIASESIAAGDFFSAAHRSIFNAMLAAAEQHESIEFIHIVESLRRSGQLDRIGGPAYCASLTDGAIADRGSIGEYARILKAKSRLRNIIASARAIEAQALAGTDSISDIYESAIARFLELDSVSEAERTSYTFKESAESLLKILDKCNLLRIETGIGGLDAITGGFLAGELIVFTAETGAGKTLLAQQTRINSCRRGQHGLFCSAEMTKEQLAAREIATSAGIERYKMRFPERLDVQEWERLGREASQQCSSCRILEGEITMQRVAAAAKRMKADGLLSLIVIDYDELISSAGRDELERQAAVASACKSLARRMQVPVILISQLRKLLNGEERRHPTLDRLYGAGAKIKHASTIVFAWRKYLETHAKEDHSTARLIVLKNRNGTQGGVRVYFDVKTLAFRDLTEDEQADAESQPKRGRPPKPASHLPFKDD